ncbi:hypothetical protein HIMB11_00834 [Rhodobacteraceae bacterium HIMB11]|nr:hypothetical protein HIMB11_00834 [Rhodobacteraceae bacterium HIMB11]
MPTLARLVILSNSRILFISWLAILTQLYDADFIKSKIPAHSISKFDFNS